LVVAGSSEQCARPPFLSFHLCTDCRSGYLSP
jgi:hypothetical protein